MSAVIERVKPEVDGGRFAAKRVAGEKVMVSADIFTYGNESVSARLLYQKKDETTYREAPMKQLENERFYGEFFVAEEGVYYYTIEAWVDEFKTWQKNLKRKLEAGFDLSGDIAYGKKYIGETSEKSSENDKNLIKQILETLEKERDTEKITKIFTGAELSDLMVTYTERIRLTKYPRELCVVVERKKALFSTWYELFPRSCPKKKNRHGTLKDVESIIPEIAGLGFDVLYLPPIHPIGTTKRKGRNNSAISSLDDVGNPWSIGSSEGGHKSLHPQLGTFEDFDSLIKKAREFNMEIAIELAFQCSADHPYVKEHHEWFKWHNDGSVVCSENIPKKFEDIVPFNFDIPNRKALWNELKSIVEFWIEKGVRIFRVDSPYTKPFVFWEWLIREIKNKYPDVIFLAEAFTRQGTINYLSKSGFTQSYTFFMWRNTKKQLIDYMNELTNTDMREFFRPNFWPNTHEMFPEHLQYDGRQIFMIRYVLAATLSSNCGIYGPAYELCVQESAQGKEEYLNSEKYEIKEWDWDKQGNIKEFIKKVNIIRQQNPALQSTWNIHFQESDNDNLLVFSKTTEDMSNIIYVIINLDPYHTQSGWVKVPIADFGIQQGQPYLAQDLLGGGKFVWNNEWNYVELNPQNIPAHIIAVKKKLKNETDDNFFIK